MNRLVFRFFFVTLALILLIDGGSARHKSKKHSLRRHKRETEPTAQPTVPIDVNQSTVKILELLDHIVTVSTNPARQTALEALDHILNAISASPNNPAAGSLLHALQQILPPFPNRTFTAREPFVPGAPPVPSISQNTHLEVPRMNENENAQLEEITQTVHSMSQQSSKVNQETAVSAAPVRVESTTPDAKLAQPELQTEIPKLEATNDIQNFKSTDSLKSDKSTYLITSDGEVLDLSHLPLSDIISLPSEAESKPIPQVLIPEATIAEHKSVEDSAVVDDFESTSEIPVVQIESLEKLQAGIPTTKVINPVTTVPETTPAKDNIKTEEIPAAIQEIVRPVLSVSETNLPKNLPISKTSNADSFKNLSDSKLETSSIAKSASPKIRISLKMPKKSKNDPEDPSSANVLKINKKPNLSPDQLDELHFALKNALTDAKPRAGGNVGEESFSSTLLKLLAKAYNSNVTPRIGVPEIMHTHDPTTGENSERPRKEIIKPKSGRIGADVGSAYAAADINKSTATTRNNSLILPFLLLLLRLLINL
ncbi:uncharacterized protein LOC132204998 isoform X2 [Neocloeon triangulifer]|uniref:uncharacterized protein LOC132204998 isoform X2 n=1 Tax=Neocloeon triangulifer TaxID=2078957 RepID=UPI00286F4B2B|nr:uncharacterized protein LOC132204998 isoform X2 [Neocloeon triangulifer]